MASVYGLKPRFQAVLKPACIRLAAAGVTANQVTVFACSWSIRHGLMPYFFPGAAIWLLLLPVTLFARMAFDAIDGMLAREHGQKTRLGAILNELTDVVSDAAPYLPFAPIAGVPAVAAVMAVVLSGLAEMTGVLGQALGSGRRYEGPMGKSDPAFAYGLLSVLIGTGLGSAWLRQLYIWMLVLLLAATVFNHPRGLCGMELPHDRNACRQTRHCAAGDVGGGWCPCGSGRARRLSGGILDRIDSLTFTAPLYFHLLAWFSLAKF